jgi:hypothetical protein
MIDATAMCRQSSMQQDLREVAQLCSGFPVKPLLVNNVRPAHQQPFKATVFAM